MSQKHDNNEEVSKTQDTGNGETVESTNSLEQVQAELEKSKKEYLYLLAEFDNYRKNAIKERAELTKFGSERFIREFLNVFDNFERALETEVSAENLVSFRSGVEMIAGEIQSLLQRFGVQELKAEGQPFDPNSQEALSSEPRSDLPVGHVARVFRKGYKMHDKLIRPAQVTVAAAPPTAN